MEMHFDHQLSPSPASSTILPSLCRRKMSSRKACLYDGANGAFLPVVSISGHGMAASQCLMCVVGGDVANAAKVCGWVARGSGLVPVVSRSSGIPRYAAIWVTD